MPQEIIEARIVASFTTLRQAGRDGLQIGYGNTPTKEPCLEAVKRIEQLRAALDGAPPTFGGIGFALEG